VNHHRPKSGNSKTTLCSTLIGLRLSTKTIRRLSRLQTPNALTVESTNLLRRISTVKMSPLSTLQYWTYLLHRKDLSKLTTSRRTLSRFDGSRPKMMVVQKSVTTPSRNKILRLCDGYLLEKPWVRRCEFPISPKATTITSGFALSTNKANPLHYRPLKVLLPKIHLPNPTDLVHLHRPTGTKTTSTLNGPHQEKTEVRPSHRTSSRKDQNMGKSHVAFSNKCKTLRLAALGKKLRKFLVM
jgi:hypothetical protein